MIQLRVRCSRGCRTHFFSTPPQIAERFRVKREPRQRSQMQAAIDESAPGITLARFHCFVFMKGTPKVIRASPRRYLTYLFLFGPNHSDSQVSSSDIRRNQSGRKQCKRELLGFSAGSPFSSWAERGRPTASEGRQDARGTSATRTPRIREAEGHDDRRTNRFDSCSLFGKKTSASLPGEEELQIRGAVIRHKSAEHPQLPRPDYIRWGRESPRSMDRVQTPPG
jgi:hypothetical protein